MKLKHQSTPQPQTDPEASSRKYVDDSISSALSLLFSWNHTSVSQLTLTQPLSDGWTMAFVAATSSEPEHILITAPPAGGATLAFVTVTAGLTSADHEVVAVHSFFGSGTQTVSVISRVVNMIGGIFVGARWSMGAGGSLDGFYADGFGDTVIADSIEPVPDVPPVTVETQLSVRGLSLGKGWGRLANYGSIDASTEAGLGTDLDTGMRFTQSAPASQTLKIYNWYAYKRTP